jgi:hypothetical protein
VHEGVVKLGYIDYTNLVEEKAADITLVYDLDRHTSSHNPVAKGRGVCKTL